MAFKGKKKIPRGAVPRKGLGKKEKQFLHLKEISHGRPNEISFNVLEKLADSAHEPDRGWFRDRSDRGVLKEKASASEKTEPAKKAKDAQPQGFLGADSRKEIEHRQRKRKLYRRMSIAFVVLACCALVGVGGYVAYDRYVKFTASVGVLKESCSLIEQSDETIVAIDNFFSESFGDDTVSKAQSLKDSIPDVQNKLEDARVYASKAEGELEGSQRDREAAQHALNTVAARQRLLDQADKRLDDDIAAKKALDKIAEADNAVKEGNSLLVRAAQVVSDTTEKNVETSTEYTTQAGAKFSEAEKALEEVETLYPSADVSQMKEYVSLRQTAVSEALSSNAAILLQDKKTAESHNDAYNKADKKATSMAGELPAEWKQAVVDAYVKNSQSLIDSYEAARSDAAVNDSFLRDYLGSS